MLGAEKKLCDQHDCLFFQNQANLAREQLSRIDNDLMQAKKDLVDIKELRKDCLRELGLRGHFVKWVQEALEGKFTNRLHMFFFNRRLC